VLSWTLRKHGVSSQTIDPTKFLRMLNILASLMDVVIAFNTKGWKAVASWADELSVISAGSALPGLLTDFKYHKQPTPL
jgi:hypothetical protein